MNLALQTYMIVSVIKRLLYIVKICYRELMAKQIPSMLFYNVLYGVKVIISDIILHMIVLPVE